MVKWQPPCRLDDLHYPWGRCYVPHFRIKMTAVIKNHRAKKK